MDIGVISDIHGDYKALEAVLDRLDKLHQVDEILCAGDLIGRGPEQNRVVDIIRRRDIPTVRGNHDEWFYGLSGENSDYLKNLPIDWRGVYENTAIFMCHGKPGNNLWGLYRDHISETLLNMMLHSLQADVLITGHTHMPMYIRVEQGCVLNPGSVYTFNSARATSHTYGVLHLPDLSFDLYDVSAKPIKRIEYE
jgi:putative phosphoesterase